MTCLTRYRFSLDLALISPISLSSDAAIRREGRRPHRSVGIPLAQEGVDVGPMPNPSVLVLASDQPCEGTAGLARISRVHSDENRHPRLGVVGHVGADVDLDNRWTDIEGVRHVKHQKQAHFSRVLCHQM